SRLTGKLTCAVCAAFLAFPPLAAATAEDGTAEGGAHEAWLAEGYAFTLYGAGVNTAWTTDILTGDLEFDEALFIGASAGKRLFAITDTLSVEAELQIGRHLAGLDHW